MSIAYAGTNFPDPSVFPGDVTVTDALEVVGDTDCKGDLDVTGTLNAGAVVVTGVDTAIAIVDTVQSHTTKDLRLETKDSGAGMTFASATGIVTVDTEILVDDIKEKTGGVGTTINSVELKSGQINTGQGLTEVYGMDQAVTTASNVTFTQVKTDSIVEKSLLAGVTIESVKIEDGTLEAATLGGTVPSYSFTDPTYGVGKSGTAVHLIAAGVNALQASSTQLQTLLPLRLDNGSAGAPSHSFLTDSSTGMYRSAGGDLKLSVVGVSRLDISTTGTTVTGNSTTTGQFLASAGVLSSPSYSFSTSTNTGFYLISPGIIGIVAGGVITTVVTATSIVNIIPMAVPAGTSSLASYQFSGSATNTGFYAVAANRIGVAVSGVNKMTIDSTGVFTTEQNKAANGTVALPSYSFTSDTDTGFYRKASNEVSLALGGVEVVAFNATTVTFNTVKITTSMVNSPASALTLQQNGTNLMFIRPAVNGGITFLDILQLSGNALNGSATASGNLILSSTTNATKGSIVFNDPPQFPSFTVGTVPSAAIAGRMVYVSNETGGPTMAFSDGTNWRRVQDRAIIS